MSAEYVFRFDPVEYLFCSCELPIDHHGEDGLQNSPADNDFFGANFVMQFIHCPMVLHVYCNLLRCFAVQHRERRSHVDFGFRAHAEKCPNNSILSICTSEVVVEDGEERDRMNCYARW